MIISYQLFPEDRGLVVQTDDPTAVLAAVPSAFRLNGSLVGMPHNVDSVVRLAAKGFQLPSPIESYYGWPHDAAIFPTIFAHQKRTASFLTQYPRAYCLNGIGTMKTISSLWAADYLLSAGDIARVLIVAPIESLERAWGDTLFIHMTHRTFAVLHGSAERRRKLLAQPKDFYIINPDGLPVVQKELMARADLDACIIDELADFRNKTEAWKALYAIIGPGGCPRIPWVWGLTATPRPQAASDPYYQCKLVTPWTVPQFFGSFKRMTMAHQSTYVWTDRPEAQDIILKAMRPAIRFKRDECLDLPGEVFSTLDVDLSKEQKLHYQEIQRELMTQIAGKRVSAVNEGVKRSKLLQIACGVVYDTDGTPHEIDAGTRIETLLHTLERIDEKVIVFVPFTEVTNVLARKISKYWSTAIVYGAVPRAERDQIFSDFQKRHDPSVLIAHPECMSRSLTLTEASTIIWYAPIDSNYTYEQANGRITRQGQKYVANVIHLAGSPIERKMYKRLQDRQSVQGLLLDMVERGESLL